MFIPLAVIWLCCGLPETGEGKEVGLLAQDGPITNRDSKNRILEDEFNHTSGTHKTPHNPDGELDPDVKGETISPVALSSELSSDKETAGVHHDGDGCKSSLTFLMGKLFSQLLNPKKWNGEDSYYPSWVVSKDLKLPSVPLDRPIHNPLPHVVGRLEELDSREPATEVPGVVTPKKDGFLGEVAEARNNQKEENSGSERVSLRNVNPSRSEKVLRPTVNETERDDSNTGIREWLKKYNLTSTCTHIRDNMTKALLSAFMPAFTWGGFDRPSDNKEIVFELLGPRSKDWRPREVSLQRDDGSNSSVCLRSKPLPGELRNDRMNVFNLAFIGLEGKPRSQGLIPSDSKTVLQNVLPKESPQIPPLLAHTLQNIGNIFSKDMFTTLKQFMANNVQDALIPSEAKLISTCGESQKDRTPSPESYKDSVFAKLSKYTPEKVRSLSLFEEPFAEVSNDRVPETIGGLLDKLVNHSGSVELNEISTVRGSKEVRLREDISRSKAKQHR